MEPINIKVVLSICKTADIYDESEKGVELYYRDDSEMLNEKLALYKAGYDSVTHGKQLTVMSPTN